MGAHFDTIEVSFMLSSLTVSDVLRKRDTLALCSGLQPLSLSHKRHYRNKQTYSAKLTSSSAALKCEDKTVKSSLSL